MGSNGEPSKEPKKESNKEPLKFEAFMHLDLDDVTCPRQYIDYQTRDPKTKKLGKIRMEPMDYYFEHDSFEEEIWPSFQVCLTTTNKELIDKFHKNKMNMRGYRFKLTLEEVVT